MHIVHFPLDPKTKPKQSEWKEGDLKRGEMLVRDSSGCCRRWVAAATRWRWAGAAHGCSGLEEKPNAGDPSGIFWDSAGNGHHLSEEP